MEAEKVVTQRMRFMMQDMSLKEERIQIPSGVSIKFQARNSILWEINNFSAFMRLLRLLRAGGCLSMQQPSFHPQVKFSRALI